MPKTEKTKMSDFDRDQQVRILCTATQAAGVGASSEQIAETLQRMLGALDAASVARKSFTGTLIHIDKELSSNRGLIVLKTRVHPKYNQVGQDILRSERLDGDEAQAARELMNSARTMFGHKVRVTVRFEPSENDEERGNRTLVAIESLGVDPEYDAQKSEFTISPRLALDTGKLLSFQR